MNAKHYYIGRLMPPEPARDIRLPIDDVLPELHDALRSHSSVVLQASPGAGKTTRVPIALLNEPWLAGRRLLMLEPRHLATRAAARRMAAVLGESVGQTVGFRVRGETRVSAATRVEVVTEGILTRMLLDDPTLDSIGAVLFDEFHERSLNADFGLALTLQAQSLLRPDLRILVMSATLDGGALATMLDNAPVITSVGRAYPVEVRYKPCRPDLRLDGCIADAVRAAIASDEGGVLAFLPGAGEIRRCLGALERASLGNDVRVYPLYGDLPSGRQDAAIAPAPAGVRKVVLATSVAETSLTIEDVRVVVDSGVSRVSRFSPRTGMTSLETIRASRSSATQRSGRAGRVAPGVCYRLWSEFEDGQLAEHGKPEILDADLAPLALDLAAAGIRDLADLRWLDLPPAAALAHARELLAQLGAIDRELGITPHGRAMAKLGLHPRLAHMTLAAQARGAGATACIVAALLDERDIIAREGGRRDADMRTRLALAEDRITSADVDRDALRRVRDQSRRWRDLARVPKDERANDAMTGVALALAYPERVAQRREGGGDRYLMRNGTGAVLDDAGSLANAEFIAIAHLDGRAPHARVYLAAPIERVDVELLFEADIEVRDVVEWNAVTEGVSAIRQRRLGTIVLRESTLHNPDAEQVMTVVADAIVRGDVSLPWSGGACSFLERVSFMRARDSSWPDLSEATLISSAQEWLRPHLAGVRRRSHVEDINLVALLESMLTWSQRSALEQRAPTHVTVPTGSRIRVDYSDPSSPALAVRLQEMFGLAETPRVGDVALTLHLLSPAGRPVQVTRDLAGFWRSSYFDVRKDLRGRYPKHEWPEDPLRAAPTRRAKPR
ncbi:ATP-dependent helicase HrpB [soil metagenome]